MTASLLPQIKARFFDANNNPLSFGKVYAYEAGSQVFRDTFKDFSASVGSKNTNPVVLDIEGSADIWLSDGLPYKIVVDDAEGTLRYSADNVVGSGGSGGSSALGTVFISALDPVAGFLSDKLLAGVNITLDITTNVSGDNITVAVVDSPTFTGDVTANKFIGDGSELTNLPLSGFVPYTGADKDVNLGSNNLVVTGDIGSSTYTDYVNKIYSNVVRIDNLGDTLSNNKLLDMVQGNIVSTQSVGDISNNGLGKVLKIIQNNPNNTQDALNVENTGLGSALQATATGGDYAGVFSGGTSASILALNGIVSLGNVSAPTFNGGTLSGSNTGDQDLSGYVPYTGASDDVDLGIYDMTANSFTGDGSGLTGVVASVSGTDGIEITGTSNDPIIGYQYNQDVLDSFSGTTRDVPFLTLEDAGANWYVNIVKDGGGDIATFMDGIEQVLDCTTGAGVGGSARSNILTFGALGAPSMQYVWLELDGGGVPFVVTGSAIPKDRPNLPMGVYKLLDEVTTTADGPLFFQRFNNAIMHPTQEKGLLTELAEVARLKGPTIIDGILGSLTIGTVGGGVDTLHLGLTSGNIRQVHDQITGAYPVPNEYYVVNDPVTPYKKITDLNQIDVDANGGTLKNNSSRFGLTFAVANSSQSQGLSIYVWLPVNNYGNDSQAISDSNNYSYVSINIAEQFTISRVCRAVLRWTNSSGGTYTNLLGGDVIQDQRNDPIGSTGGGTGASGGAAGEDTQIQFNTGGILDADAGFTFASGAVTVGDAKIGTSSVYAGAARWGHKDYDDSTSFGGLQGADGAMSFSVPIGKTMEFFENGNSAEKITFAGGDLTTTGAGTFDGGIRVPSGNTSLNSLYRDHATDAALEVVQEGVGSLLSLRDSSGEVFSVDIFGGIVASSNVVVRDQRFLGSLPSDPSSKLEGDMWWNSTAKKLRLYNGSTVQDLN